MKQKVAVFLRVALSLCLLFSLAACGNESNIDSTPSTETDDQKETKSSQAAPETDPVDVEGNDGIIPLDYVLFDNEDFYVAVTGFDTNYESDGEIKQGLMIDFVNRTTETDVFSPDYKRADVEITDVNVNGCRSYASSLLGGFGLTNVEPGTSSQGYRFCSPSKISGIRYIDTLTFRCAVKNIHDEPLYEDHFTLEIHAGEGEAVYTPEFDGAPFILIETDQCLAELVGYYDEPDTGIRRYVVHAVNNTDKTIHVDAYHFDVNGIEDFNANNLYCTVQPNTDAYGTFYFAPELLASSGVYSVDSIRFSSLACFYHIIQEDGSRKPEYIAKTAITVPYPGEAVGPLIDPDGSTGE